MKERYIKETNKTKKTQFLKMKKKNYLENLEKQI